MNSDDTKKRINQMCEFIKQEAKEKAKFYGTLKN